MGSRIGRYDLFCAAHGQSLATLEPAKGDDALTKHPSDFQCG
jgi:hypothetical protein